MRRAVGLGRSELSESAGELVGWYFAEVGEETLEFVERFIFR
jgi:hypothetical protein